MAVLLTIHSVIFTKGFVSTLEVWLKRKKKTCGPLMRIDPKLTTLSSNQFSQRTKPYLPNYKVHVAEIVLNAVSYNELVS